MTNAAAPGGAVFEGIRVVDFTSGIAGPYATMYLADHGADVVKVEPPEGDPYRAEPGFQLFNRGKRSVVLDLATVEGREQAQRLALAADVVVVDVPQGRARSLGIDDAALRHGSEGREANPRLVYLGMPPFGERGPYVDRPGSPALVAAATGMMGNQASYSGDPSYLVLPLPAYGAAPLGAAAVAAALYTRERAGGGLGQFLEVSLLAGAAALQIGGVRSSAFPMPIPTGGDPMGSRGRIPAYRLFEAGDGRWFFLACGSADFYNRMLIAIERTDLIADDRLANPPWGHITPEAREALAPVLEETFRSQPREHWLRLFREADVPAQPVQSRDEYFDSDLVRANDMRIRLDHPEHGAVEMMGVPLVLEAAPGAVRSRAPLLGEHTDEVLGTLESSRPDSPSPAPREPGPEGEAPRHLLEGVRVLDLTSFIAGPVVGRHLATMGADAIKVEAPSGDAFRVMGLGFLGWNQGKRGLGLNLRLDAAREVLYRLAREADVVVENFRPGVTDRLGVDYETLRAINPRLVYLSSPGYGDDQSMLDVPAFDPLVQALSGAMQAQGNGDEPVFFTVALNDVMTPAIATFGICAALYHRERTGEGQRVRTALARTGLAIQAAEFTRLERGGRPPLEGGRDFPGPDAGRRLYRCADGRWLYVEAATDAQRAALAAALDVDLAPADRAAPYRTSECARAAEALAAAFATRDLAAAVAALDAAEVPCIAVVPRGGTFDAEHLHANDLVVQLEHPQWGKTTDYGVLVRASATPGRTTTTAPALSQHAPEILAELDYTPEEQRALAEAGAVVWPAE